jgi:hypothetical protein
VSRRRQELKKNRAKEAERTAAKKKETEQAVVAHLSALLGEKDDQKRPIKSLKEGVNRVMAASKRDQPPSPQQRGKQSPKSPSRDVSLGLSSMSLVLGSSPVSAAAAAATSTASGRGGRRKLPKREKTPRNNSSDTANNNNNDKKQQQQQRRQRTSTKHKPPKRCANGKPLKSKAATKLAKKRLEKDPKARATVAKALKLMAHPSNPDIHDDGGGGGGGGGGNKKKLTTKQQQQQKKQQQQQQFEREQAEAQKSVPLRKRHTIVPGAAANASLPVTPRRWSVGTITDLFLSGAMKKNNNNNSRNGEHDNHSGLDHKNNHNHHNNNNHNSNSTEEGTTTEGKSRRGSTVTNGGGGGGRRTSLPMLQAKNNLIYQDKEAVEQMMRALKAQLPVHATPNLVFRRQLSSNGVGMALEKQHANHMSLDGKDSKLRLSVNPRSSPKSQMFDAMFTSSLQDIESNLEGGISDEETFYQTKLLVVSFLAWFIHAQRQKAYRANEKAIQALRDTAIHQKLNAWHVKACFHGLERALSPVV